MRPDSLRALPPARRALLVGIAGFVVLGLTDGALGTVWPDLRDDFGRSDGHFGQLFVCLAGGYLIASAASGHLSDRWGMAVVIRTGSGCAALALATIGLGLGWGSTLAGFAMLGLANGLLDSTINAWVAVARGTRAMGLLHGFYGVGAAAGPLVATVFVVSGGRWQVPFWIFAAAQAAVLVSVPWARAGFDEEPVSPDVVAAQADVASGRPALLPLVLGWFFLYVGVEVAVGQWSFTLLTEARGSSDVVAGVLAASYWGGLTVGRFALAAVGHRRTPEAMMSGATILAIVAVAVFAVDPFGLGGLALPVLGFAFSVMFPAMVNRTPVYLGAERAPKVVGYQLATSSAGAIVVPSLVGVLADRSDTEVLGPVSVATVVAMALTWLAVRAAAPTRAS